MADKRFCKISASVPAELERELNRRADGPPRQPFSWVVSDALSRGLGLVPGSDHADQGTPVAGTNPGHAGAVV